MTQTNQLRSPIVTICGHVDHGKTSVLDCFRGTSQQKDEAGGITQKISFTKYPLEQIKKACPLIEKSGINMEIPGFLFIDTPGHAAFTNLRKRGGSLADLAILVINIKEGIKPQTAEVLQILKTYKTPFLIALNKIDIISGWRQQSKNLKESIEMQPVNVKNEFDECLLTFQSALQSHGFESDLYYEMQDFSKKIALVPCSAKTKEGIPELLFVLSGLCQKFLKERLKLTDKEAKGVILEIKKEKTNQWAEAIIYDGQIDEGDEIVIASFNEPITAKIRALSEILPLSQKYHPVKHAIAATGVRMQLTNSDEILPGMPFQEVKDKDNIEEIKKAFKKEISGATILDKQGIIVKADSLGSLEALLTLLRQEHIQILKAGIGNISKQDIISATANLDINPLDAIILGFNTEIEKDLEIPKNIKILKNDVVYKLIENLALWRKEKESAILKEKLLGLATICKLEILAQYVFRNSNPAVFGIKITAGKAKLNIPLIDQLGEQVGHIKSLQADKIILQEAKEGQEIAMSIPGVAFDRRLKEIKYLYADIGEQQFKNFKKHKDILSANELKVLQEIHDIKIKKKADWGI